MIFFTKQDLPKYTCKWESIQHTLILGWTTFKSCQVGNIFAHCQACNSSNSALALNLWIDLPNQPKPTAMSSQMNTLMNKKETHLPNEND